MALHTADDHRIDVGWSDLLVTIDIVQILLPVERIRGGFGTSRWVPADRSVPVKRAFHRSRAAGQAWQLLLDLVDLGGGYRTLQMDASIDNGRGRGDSASLCQGCKKVV